LASFDVVDLPGLAFVDVDVLRPLPAAATDRLTARLRDASRLAGLVLDASGLARVLPVDRLHRRARRDPEAHQEAPRATTP